MLRRYLFKILSAIPFLGAVGFGEDLYLPYSVTDFYLHSEENPIHRSATIIYKNNCSYSTCPVSLISYTIKQYYELRKEVLEHFRRHYKIKNILVINICSDRFSDCRNAFFINMDIVDIDKTIIANESQFNSGSYLISKN